MTRMLTGMACLLFATVVTCASPESPDPAAADFETQDPNVRPKLPDRPVGPPDYPVIPDEPDSSSLLERVMDAAKKADSQTEICCLPFDDCVFVTPGDCEIPAVNYGD